MLKPNEQVYCKYCTRFRNKAIYSTRYQKCQYCIDASKGAVNKGIHKLSTRVTPIKKYPYTPEPEELTKKRKRILAQIERILAQIELDKINSYFDL